MTHARKAQWQELIIEITLTLLFTIATIRMPHWIYEAIPSTVDPALMPKITAGVAALCCVLLTFHAAMGVCQASKGRADPSSMDMEEQGSLRSVLAYIVLLFSYVAALYLIGFIAATPIVMLVLARMLGIRRWMIGLACYILFTLVLYYACFYLMQVILPPGILFQTILG